MGWAERALLDGEFEPENVEMRSSVNARLGGAGVRAIGLTWDGREDLLWQLGYKVRVEIGPC